MKLLRAHIFWVSLSKKRVCLAGSSNRGPTCAICNTLRIQRKFGGWKRFGESDRAAVWSTAEGTKDSSQGIRGSDYGIKEVSDFI